VVILAKRDRGGRRFGFARFDQVEDDRRFEQELDTILIGRDKISVNLSHFHRFDLKKNNDNIREDRRENGGAQDRRENNGVDTLAGAVPRGDLQSNHFSNADKPSYAKAVKKGNETFPSKNDQRVFMSYEADKEVLDKYRKAFVGEALQPGMTYNIQNAFHRQGYFGVKVTPLGANLTLLEGQDEGEVKALVTDAKSWLEQWFKDIRPWSPKEIDHERVAWLRVFGIPLHAWNDLFFTQLLKPWGVYMRCDDGTSRKITMDVARLLIRTSCQKPVDEFLDVSVNGEIFHLRVVEDSYGPMRIIDPQTNNSNDDKNDGFSMDEEDDEEDDEEEEVEGLGRLMEEEVGERDSNGEPRNITALIPRLNASNDQDFLSEAVSGGGGKEQHNNLVSNDSISSFSNTGGVRDSVEGVVLKDNNLVKGKILLGQEGVVGGSQNSTPNQPIVTGGTVTRRVQSDNVGQAHCVDLVLNKGSNSKEKGGVYSDGPRNVYRTLNKGPDFNKELVQLAPVRNTTTATRVHPIPAGIRRQQKLIKDLHLSVPSSSSSHAVSTHWLPRKNLVSSGTNNGLEGVHRKPPHRSKNNKTQQQPSLSSAGEILCCSSINPSDIRNCNKRVVATFHHDTAKKVWKEATELGVVGVEGDEVYVKRILYNENKEDEARVQREQQQNIFP
jgi:hypothetical protein